MLFHRSVPVIFLFVASAAPLAARVTIGGYGSWAAFCDEPRRCFAIAQPAERADGASLAVLIAGRDVRVQAHVGRPVRSAQLEIGASRFDLTADGEDVRADAATSRRIVAALRTGETLTVAGRSERGRFRHHYALAGAATAIDAAALASLR